MVAKDEPSRYPAHVTTLANSVANWLGRVELLARGIDEKRRDAQRSLEQGNPVAARTSALALLAEVPDSPVGLALLVDACEALWLDEEAVSALRKLCASAPWRAELWVRLAEAMLRIDAPLEDIAKVLENALKPDMDPIMRRRALLLLTDLDLDRGDAARASRWLDALRLQDLDPHVALRRLELALILGDRAGMKTFSKAIGQPEPLDGRAALALGRAGHLDDDPTSVDWLLRAYFLEV
jgi:tetratricopeptide (TPR) repeat protein